jgi:hypothetical protein
MPRGKKRTTQSGADAQSVSSVPGQRYGEGVEQQQLQQNMPAPDLAAAGPGGNDIVMPQPGPPVTPAPQGDPAQMMDYLKSNNPSLFSGTQMPDVPVTDGLLGGAGRGPEALVQARAVTPVARYLINLSEESGNVKWKRLAERAGLR